MRACNAAQFSRSRKNDIIEVNESKALPSEEPEEESNTEPTVEVVSQSSPNSGNSESSDSEEPKEDPEEEPEEDPVEEPEEDPEEQPEEETEEQLEEDLEVDSEQDSEEESSEEPEEESTTEYGAVPLSWDNNDEINQLVEDPDEEDPLEEYVSEPASESDTNEADYKCTNGKTRSVDATEFETTPFQVYPSQKKCRYEEPFKPELDVVSAFTDLHSESGVSEAVVKEDGASLKQEHVGSSGKQRRSRWDLRPERDGETCEGDRSSKRRKTRWASDDSQLKMLVPIQLPDFRKDFVQDGETGEGDRSSKRRKTRWDRDDSQLKKILCPIQLPDFRKDFIGSKLDLEIQGLKVKLLEINSKLRRSELHYDMPEWERSPSPEPLYNNLGIRINTREVRFREKLKRERRRILYKLIRKNPKFEIPLEHKPVKFFKKLFVPVKEYPTYKFSGLILGPRGNTKKRMEEETGARIKLRGKGSMNRKPEPSDNEELHVWIEAGNQKSLDAAVVMVEKLLIPQDDEMNDHKRAQLEELAKLKGTEKDENLCGVCREQGHKHYACPQRQSTLQAISCDTCGSIFHPTSSCPLTASPQVSNLMRHSSGLDFGSTPNTKNKSNKEISDANLYVGCLPQAMDDTQLRDLFSSFGTITEAYVIKDRTTGLSKGYGFVKFENPTIAAAVVIHMHGFQIDGKIMVVRVAGRSAVTRSSAFSQLPVYPRPAAVSSSVSSQTAWPGPPGSMLPEAQVSVQNSECLSVPSASINSRHGNHLPKCGATAFCPPSVAPSEAQVSFQNSEGLGFPLASLYSGHGNYLPKFGATAFRPSSVTLPEAQVPFRNSEGLGLPSASIYSGHSNHLPKFGAIAFSPPFMVREAQVSFQNSEGLVLPSASVYSGHVNHLPKFGATAFRPPSVVSSLNESKNAFPFPGLLAQFPGDPDYPGSEFQSYFATKTL